MVYNKNEQFSQIYDQYIDKIYRFVYLKVNSQEIAEDIVSKVFTKAWEKFRIQNSEFRIQNTSAFLYQIARNAVVDYYRERGRTKIVAADLSWQMIDPSLNSQEKAIFSVDIDIVKNAMQKLKKEHQDIIIWHYLEDMPIAEIAELIEKPESTVRVMLHRGLKELKSVINKPFQTS
jgi:RNA polymerase sigma-70 factor (ECF subfamily)